MALFFDTFRHKASKKACTFQKSLYNKIDGENLFPVNLYFKSILLLILSSGLVPIGSSPNFSKKVTNQNLYNGINTQGIYRKKKRNEHVKEEQVKKLEPYWNYWYICDNGFLGEGSFGQVYRIQRQTFDDVQYAALKIISLPKSQAEIDELQQMGMTEEEIRLYYQEAAAEIFDEIKLMSRLKGKSHIINCEDFDIIERTDSIGCYIIIRMELAKSLVEYGADREFPEEEVIRLGEEICMALLECQKHNILHRDIKPANIFVSADGDFKLGDFGIARRDNTGLSIKGSYNYMAPEVYYGKEYDERVDIYSLGIVLYSYLNQKRIPFLEEGSITQKSQQEAIKRRFHGEQPSFPKNVPEKLQKIIAKAISFEREDRYKNAQEFLDALREYQRERGNLRKEAQAPCSSYEQTVVLRFTPEQEDRCRKQKEKPQAMESTPETMQHSAKRRSANFFKVLKRGILIAGVMGIVMIVPNMGYSGEIYSKQIQQISSSQTNSSQVPDGTKQIQENVKENKKQETGGQFVTKSSIQGKIIPTEAVPSFQPQITLSPTIKATRKPKDNKKIVKKKKKAGKIVATPKNSEEKKINPEITVVEETVAPVLASKITLPTSLQMVEGSSMSLPVEITPKNAEYKIISTNAEIVGISGVTLKAKRQGVCEITVVSGTVKKNCSVGVTRR